nr:ASN_HP1_G0027470.mRNA.1.CDS.1 [Saccharomyces cerevisiae]
MGVLENIVPGELYDANYDPDLLKIRKETKIKLHEYNTLSPADENKKSQVIRELLGSCTDNFIIEPPFYCDYGSNIYIGDNFYANHNLVIWMGPNIVIGDNVFIAPNVGIYTAGHPIDVERRLQGLEYAMPVTIRDNVWIGGGVSIIPGVNIGKNSVIAAGSVVIRDIPENVVAAGNPFTLETDEKTDFWRETFYGFTRDSGHFLGVETDSAFTAQVRVQGSYESLYDQAGIMVRIDDGHWLKAGIEISDGHAMLSSVLTNGKSDWSTAVYGGNARDFWLRVTVEKGVLRLQVSSDKKTWPLVRLAPFPTSDHYLVGPMACTPERGGLKVTFSEWSLTAPLGKALHDLS